jgi:transposase
MSNQKNHYPEEFRESSAKLAMEPGSTVKQVADDLGVHVKTLEGWIKKYGPKEAEQLSDKAELKRLRKECARLKQERDILKKAAAYFASETL